MADYREGASREQGTSRYVVGIDLGTTNSAMAFVDTQQCPWRVQHLPVEQLVAPSVVEPRDTLPSFHYQGTLAESRDRALALPWSKGDPTCAVGWLAREEGTKKPGRLIASAKSWLCHAGVDRTAEVLPWQGAADVERLSPVEVTARFLRHLRDVWNHHFPAYPLAQQDLVITLPASFDEVARELTIRAARLAELPRIALVEEPQAAFYAWVDKHAHNWQELVTAGQKILVCDIGGGTSDFTLIRVSAADGEAPGEVQFHRVAVGEHLILGGDNLDLAVAHHLESQVGAGEQLTPAQWDVLVRTARRVKETMLSDHPPAQLTISLPAAGSQLIGGAIQVEARRDEIQQLLVEGFLPWVELTDAPQRRRVGFQEFGLPFAPDAAITRYLAAFLLAHQHTGATPDTDPGSPAESSDSEAARPDVVLFNGGFFASSVLRQRLLESLSRWFSSAECAWAPVVLDNERLDLAVARGAAYYGMVRRGEGVGITASLARSYYLSVAGEVEGKPAAVCLAPGDASPGQSWELAEQAFHLTVSEPVEFGLLVSSTRLTDRAGELVGVNDDQFTALPPIRTVLHASRRSDSTDAEVHLQAHLTELGTMELAFREREGKRSWQLQFDVRSTTQTDREAHQSAAEQEGFVDEDHWNLCETRLRGVFDREGQQKPSSLMKHLVDDLQLPRHEWPTSLCRRIWETLYELEAGRRRSPAHEARWLNLLGFALRPGYGFAVDDWRVAETWRMVRDKLAFAPSQQEAWVLWRRIAGGLSRGQQLVVAEPLVAALRAMHRRMTGGKQGGSAAAINPAESVEIWRLVGSLESLDVPLKLELGNAIGALLPKRKLSKVRSAMVWALGRLGQRVPVHGPLNTVVPSEVAQRWVETLMRQQQGEPIEWLAAMQLTRRTDDRRRDVAGDLRQQVADWIRAEGGGAHLVQLVEEGGGLDARETTEVLGESLPRGLRLA
jgi:molecular chaperone DnaK (HSP70)